MNVIYFLILLQAGLLLAKPQQLLILDGPKGSFPEDTLAVYISDENREPAHQVQKQELHMALSDQPVEVKSVKHLIESRPVKMMFVVDISGTMAGPPLTNVKHALASWMGRLPANIEVGLSTIGNDFRVEHDFTNNRTSLLRILDTLGAHDQFTELFYGVYKALDQFSNKTQKSQSILVLFSDGHNEGSEAFTLQDCVDLAQTNHVFIQAIGFHRIDSIYLKNLEKLGRMSGGIFVNPSTPKAITTAYDRVYRYLFSSYQVAFNLKANSSGDNQPLRIVLNLPSSNVPFNAYVGLLDVPSRLPSYVIVGLVLLLVITLVVAILLWKKKQFQFLSLQKNSQEQNAGLKNNINKYQKNLDELQAKLEEAGKIDGTHTEDVEKQSFTQIIDDRVPLNLSLDFSVDDKKGDCFDIDSFPARIGKGKNADIKLSEPTVSRMHAVIVRKRDGFQLEDLHSTNGTWVNRKKISVNMIHNGDQIQFGKINCIVKID